MRKQLLFYFLLVFILTDISYSFVQDLQMPLDGDMAESILPAKGYEKIFKDPLGISVITKNAAYPNPNRFFVQWAYACYFQHSPFLLQKFVNPIDSIYYCSAIAKIIIQIGILILLGIYITGKRTVFTIEFLIAIALITPLFQTNGYRSYMGIIDPTITYTFSYALPCAFLLLFYLPFFNASFYNKEISKNKLVLILLFLFSFVLALGGPLIPGAVLIISLLFFFFHFKLNYSLSPNLSFLSKCIMSLKKIPRLHFFYFSFVSILSLYSLYVGQNNTMFINEKIPIYQRYLKLPEGLYQLLTQKIGYPLLILMICLNAYLIHRKYKNEDGKKILSLLKWIGIFSLLYILLLPLGGYRSYRPNIIRYDSIMPITLCLFLFYGMSSYFLIRNLKNKHRKLYLIVIFGFSFIFTFADKPELSKNKCEKAALLMLANSKENVVLLENDCTIMSWKKISDPIESELNAQLLYNWGITKEIKSYYQK